jgi:hypothetical protein
MFGSESSANGSGSITYSDGFQIQSSTLAAGTSVSLEFCVIAGFNNQVNDLISQQATTQTLNTAQATFGVGAVTSGSASGLYSYSDSRLGSNLSMTGLFASPQVTDITIVGQVGQGGSVTAILSSQSTADVVPGDIGDVQVQASLVWGAVSLTPGVTLVSLNTGLPLPDMTNCTPSYVQANIPAPLINLNSPEPDSFVLLGLGAVGLVILRRAIGAVVGTASK